MNEQQPTPHFSRVVPGVDLPELDSRVLALWDRVDAFRASIEMRTPESEYTFYDGPPFATGSPHYGNLLAGVIKDIVPRYWTMRGHRVDRGEARGDRERVFLRLHRPDLRSHPGAG